MARRYYKSRLLRPSRIVTVGDVSAYSFPSDRSPTLEWQVTLKGIPVPGGGDPGGGGAEFPVPGDGALPPGDNGRRVEHVYLIFQTINYGWCWLDGAPSTDVQVPQSATTTTTRWLLNPNRPGTIDAPDPPPALEFMPGGGTFDPDAGDEFYTETIDNCTYLYLRSKGQTFFVTGACNFPLENVQDINCIGMLGSTQSYAFQVYYDDGTILNGGPGAGGGGGDGDNENYTYRCTCPDYTREQGALGFSPWPSEWAKRSWKGSNAGITTRPGGKCKHILSAELLYRGRLPGLEDFVVGPNETPDTPPYEETWEWLKKWLKTKGRGLPKDHFLALPGQEAYADLEPLPIEFEQYADEYKIPVLIDEVIGHLLPRGPDPYAPWVAVGGFNNFSQIQTALKNHYFNIELILSEGSGEQGFSDIATYRGPRTYVPLNGSMVKPISDAQYERMIGTPPTGGFTRKQPFRTEFHP